MLPNAIYQHSITARLFSSTPYRHGQPFGPSRTADESPRRLLECLARLLRHRWSAEKPCQNLPAIDFRIAVLLPEDLRGFRLAAPERPYHHQNRRRAKTRHGTPSQNEGRLRDGCFLV